VRSVGGFVAETVAAFFVGTAVHGKCLHGGGIHMLMTGALVALLGGFGAIGEAANESDAQAER